MRVRFFAIFRINRLNRGLDAGIMVISLPDPNELRSVMFTDNFPGYCGVPAAFDGFRVMKGVFAALGDQANRTEMKRYFAGNGNGVNLNPVAEE